MRKNTSSPLSQVSASSAADAVSATSSDLTALLIAQLREIAPQAFTEAHIDFDKLKATLGGAVAEGKERYGLTWAGKAEAFRNVQTLSSGTLAPLTAESVNWDSTQNLIIEGDNLEVLKLLQRSHHGKVKMIYIDPPYNTGNEFIYPDNFHEGLQDYLRFSGQVGENGIKLGANKDTRGRYHSNWLSMMYPRLFLARNLLRDDGVIFVSIDDHEVHNLRHLLDEVFGEENFLCSLIWKSRQIVDSRSQNGASSDHEYLLAFGRTEKAVLLGQSIREDKYSNPDDDSRGPWMSNNMLGLATKAQRPNLHYDLNDPATNINFPCSEESGWRYSRETMARKIREGRVLFPRTASGRPREKLFLRELTKSRTGFSSVLSAEVGYTLHGTREVRDALGENIFQFPKPDAGAGGAQARTTDLPRPCV